MISVLMAYTKDFDALAEVTGPRLREYCQKHGYGFTIHRGEFGDTSAQFGFQKTDLVRSVLWGADVLWVVDCDCLVTNLDIKLESFLNESGDIFFTHDCNGLNAGSYLIRNTGFSRKFLSLVCDQSKNVKFPGEQDVMRGLAPLQNAGICILSHPSINSYKYEEYGQAKTHKEGQWQPGDFVLHLPGITNKRRIEIFKSL